MATSALILIGWLAAWAAPGNAYQESYRVGKFDVLRIEVANEAELTRESIAVTENGTIAFPYLGDLKVDGLTLSEIADLLKKTLVQQKILTQPAVSVTVREYRSQSVTILGEVRTTGKLYLRGSEKLLDKIAEAGGVTANAGDITISRNAPAGNQVLTVKSEDLLQDATVLQGGDVILVRPKEITQIFVSGEVISGKPITYSEGLTVSQAILMAGGVSRFGSKSKVILKRTVDGKEVLIKVNLSDIEKGKGKDLPVLPNDTIIVGRRVF